MPEGSLLLFFLVDCPSAREYTTVGALQGRIVPSDRRDRSECSSTHEESVARRCFPLDFDGEDTEQQNLDRRAGRIPVDGNRQALSE